MVRRWVAGAAAVFLLATVVLAKPGSVTTKDGQVIEGDIAEHDEKVDITSAKGIKTTILRDGVESIDYFASDDEEFQKRLAKLDAKDVQGRIDLARWAMDRKQYKLARDVLEMALDIDPNNADADALLKTARRQMQLKPATRRESAENGSEPAPGPAPGPQTAPATRSATARLVTPEEINEIRQKEWRKGDRGVIVRLENDVKRQYMNANALTPAEFNKLAAAEQGYEIILHGGKLARDVKVVNDPPALFQYRRLVQKSVLSGCAVAGCHATAGGGGDLTLFNPADKDAPAYTNFLILNRYAKTYGDTRYQMVDRTEPKQSLLVQFGLPRKLADVGHPEVQGWRPIFKNLSDPHYVEAMDWLGSSLAPMAPEYKIDLTREPPGHGDDRTSHSGEEGRGAP